MQFVFLENAFFTLQMEDLRERKDEVQAPKRSRRTPRGLNVCVCYEYDNVPV